MQSTRILVISLALSLSGCVTSCEEVEPASAQMSPAEEIDAQYTHQDKMLDLISTGKVADQGNKKPFNYKSGDSLAVFADNDNGTLIPNIINKLNSIPADKHNMRARFVEELGMTGSDLAVAALSRYLVQNAVHSDVEGMSKEELQEKETALATATASVVVRVKAALALKKVALGKFDHGSPYGIPELIVSLLDEQRVVRETAAQCLRVVTNHSKSFNSLADYDTMAFEQSRWKKWWTLNEGKKRKEWLREGFAAKGIKTGSISKAECIDPLFRVLQEIAGHLNENAKDILTHLEAENAEEKNLMNEKLMAYLESDKKKVKEVAVLGLVHLNKPITITKAKGREQITEYLFFTGHNLDPSVDFVKEWWKQKNAKPAPAPKPEPEEEEEEEEEEE